MMLLAGAVLVLACASTGDVPPAGEPAASTNVAPDTLTPTFSFHACDRLALGDPRAVTVSFSGVVVMADGSPPRLVSYGPSTDACQEFEAPAGRPAFRPSGVAVRGFFVYAVDEANRLLLRWDSSGTYRDVLINFEDLNERRRISPHGLDVDASGRTAVTDIENHQVIVFDTYLKVDVAFGNFGSYEGQFDSPEGVSFTPDGDLLVADTGNARLQIFSDTGSFRRVIPSSGEVTGMRHPNRGVVADDGRVFAADPVAGHVFEFSPAGRLVRTIRPSEPGLFKPTNLALGRDGVLFVTDSASKSLYAFKVM